MSSDLPLLKVPATIPVRYRVRPQPSNFVKPTSAEELEADEASQSSWTRGSYVSDFIDGEIGSTFGRWIRNAGQLVVDPIDNLIGTRELKKLDKFLDQLDVKGWQAMTNHFDAEGYAPRLVEVLRYPVYPQKLRAIAQRITLKLAIFGKVRFDLVQPRIHFHSKDEFHESIAQLTSAAFKFLPKSTLLLYLTVTGDAEDFLSSFRQQILRSPEDVAIIMDHSIAYRLVTFTRTINSRDGSPNVSPKEVIGLTTHFHHATLRSMHDLASSYYRQRRWKQVEEVDILVLEMMKSARGVEHADTLSSMHKLACTIVKQLRWKDAEAILLSVVEGRKRLHDEQHADTLASMDKLAEVYEQQARWTEVEELCMAAMKMRMQFLGGQHPDSLRSVQNLVRIYKKQGRTLEAETLDRRQQLLVRVNTTVTHNILVLGSMDSGKSTILKQMKIIHQSGYSRDELARYKHLIYLNLVDSAKDLALAMVKLGIAPTKPADSIYIDVILGYEFRDTTPNPVFTRAVSSLLCDPVFPKIVGHSSEVYLMDSAQYFLQEVGRICSSSYLPTEADVLRVRRKTVGITETQYNMGPQRIRMFDVGGARSERKKWINCFNDTNTIIFCSALSEYDQVLLEDSRQNRMAESLILFESVVNSRWFTRTHIILLLNKIDLFKIKIPITPLANYFPEYSGGDDISKAAKFIEAMFLERNTAGLQVTSHVIQATDTTNMRLVLADVKENITQRYLRDTLML